MSDVNSPRTGAQLETFDPASLLRGQVESSVDPLTAARTLAARSRTRTVWLTVATILAWVVACGAAIWTIEIYFNEIRPHLPIQEYRHAQMHDEIEGKPWHELTEDQRHRYSASRRVLNVNNELMMILGQASIVLFGLAALLSVWLTIASRRAALRQINANLLSITLELKKLLHATA